MADRGGWREETLQGPEIQASFLYPFSYAPLGEWGHISGELFGLFLGVCLSPTPSRQPLFETSEKKRGDENLTNYTPPKKEVLDPPLVRYTFNPSQVSVLCFFPVQKSTTEQTRGSFGGVQNFRERAFSGTFSSPIRFAPPISRPNFKLGVP